MKRLLTIVILTLVTLRLTQGQSTSDKFSGEYVSLENKFKSSSTMILKNNNTFNYYYQAVGCRGKVIGTWKSKGNKLIFENDSSLVNSKTTQYLDLGLSTWTVTEEGIQPDRVIDPSCLKVSGFHSKRDTLTGLYTSVSLIALITNPEKYHGKKVKVKGYLNLEFEGDAIYLHKEDYDGALMENGFWVSFSNKLDEGEINKLNKRYVLIDGVFDMNMHGHGGLFGGEIKDITRISKWGN